MPGDHLKSAHARYAARAALACGYTFRSLDGDDGYLFEVRDGERRAVFAAGAGTPYALNDARAASIARDKAFCADVLREAGVPVLPGVKFFVTEEWAEMRSPGRERADAIAYAETADYPLFCKPLSASNGLHAEAVDNAAEFADYLERLPREHFAILVQPYICASEYRVFVLNGRALFSYHKTPPSVWGNGERTLADLVATKNRESDAPPLRPRGRDGRGRKYQAADVPAKDELVFLEGPANRAAGGAANDLRDGASRALGQVAIDAAAAVGLSLAAVDLFVQYPSGPVVIEVNSNPMIATLEDHQRWRLIIDIWRANFDAALK